MEGYKDNSGFNAVFGSSGGGGSTPTDYNGSFSSTTTQIAGGVLTENVVSLENTLIANGISVSGTDFSRIDFSVDGYYALNFSIQLDYITGSGQKDFFVYLLLNGNAIPNSTTRYVVQGNVRYEVVSLDFLLDISGGDFIQIAYAVEDVDVVLLYENAPVGAVYPDIPSVICNAFKVG
jgi:hypothetical protein